MHNKNIRMTGLPALVLGLTLLGGCSDEADENTTASSTPQALTAPQAEDVVALVGDQVITYTDLGTMLNSSAMVGLSIPALGTPERRQTIITLLDKVISANLLYLDALKQGVNQRPPYTEDMAKYEAAIMASMYKANVLVGDFSVSEQEVLDLYTSSINPETELTADVKLALEAKLRKQKLDKRKATLRERLREGATITIDESMMDPANDNGRTDSDSIATVNGQQIIWGEVKTMMQGADQRANVSPFYVDNDAERMKRLQRHIDNTLMVSKARAAGLEQTPEFAQRTAEYRKTHLINVHRSGLAKDWAPSDDALQAYYLEHMDSIVTPESRKVQMVVVATNEEAEEIKSKIDSGEITMFQAAQQYSLDPNAKRTLGEMGWVSQGTGFKELDDFTFTLEPDIVGGPVESPAGWHLVKVLDVLDGRYQNIEDPETRKRTLRMYMKEKFDNYVVGLRENTFEVVVYDDELTRRFQKEAEMIAELSREAEQEGSVTRQRQQELQKWIEAPPQK